MSDFIPKVRFWGVRGSIPTPSPDTNRFGGNTSCVAFDLGNDMVIFDAGTGIRLLGQEILKREKPARAHLLLSHLHWDHIQGFPFFTPAYRKDCTIGVHGRGHADQTLGKILAGQMEGPNFPVSLAQLGATFTYHDVRGGETFSLLNEDSQPFAQVRCAAGNHPNGVLVFRVDAYGRSVVYATDTEHYPDGIDAGIADLAKGADLFIYDGMYTSEEYETGHKGWGHSTWEKGLEIAIAADCKRFIVFHHDPSHDDSFLDQLESTVAAAAQARAPSLKTCLAREGLEIPLD